MSLSVRSFVDFTLSQSTERRNIPWVQNVSVCPFFCGFHSFTTYWPKKTSRGCWMSLSVRSFVDFTLSQPTDRRKHPVGAECLSVCPFFCGFLSLAKYFDRTCVIVEWVNVEGGQLEWCETRWNCFRFRILDAKNFRRTPILDNNGNIIPVANNMEPVSITVAPNGQTAYVAMPVSSTWWQSCSRRSWYRNSGGSNSSSGDGGGGTRTRVSGRLASIFELIYDIGQKTRS